MLSTLRNTILLVLQLRYLNIAFLQLEDEVTKLRKELLALPKQQTAELEVMKNELIIAKNRLTDLEKELKVEFEAEKCKLIAENKNLKEKILKLVCKDITY